MLFLLVACNSKASGDAAWAVNYATVTPDAFGVSGHHVWVFFQDGWERKRTEDYHLCTLLQTVEGSLIDDLDGCEECVATYEIALTDVEHDCDDELVSSASYRGIEAFGVGDSAGDDAPYASAYQWSLSYDGEALESHGWAFDEAEDWGSATTDGWEEDGTYTLWPAYAWDLR